MMRFSRLILFLSFTFLTAIIGCKKMDDIYKDFVSGGETVYIGRADSAYVRGGNHRAEVVWLLMSDPKVSSYKLTWDNGRDSVVGEVTKTSNVDTIRVPLKNLPEGTHHFTIRMYDRYGNSSVPTFVTGTVYGSQYEGTLLHRTYRGMTRVAKSNLEISWTPAAETAVAIEAKYINRAGVEVTHTISSSLNTYTFPSFPENGTFFYRTLFKPNEVALDTFSTDFLPVEVDDHALGGRHVSFVTEARSGTLPNQQMSIWVSTDFDGVYEVANVESATWTEITHLYPLAQTTNTDTPWGPVDLWSLMDDDDTKIYIAFKYVFDPSDPDYSSGINWRAKNLTIRTNGGHQVMNHEQANFQLVNKGPLERGRISSNATTILLRSNSVDKVTPTVFWAISNVIE